MTSYGDTRTEHASALLPECFCLAMACLCSVLCVLGSMHVQPTQTYAALVPTCAQRKQSYRIVTVKLQHGLSMQFLLLQAQQAPEQCPCCLPGPRHSCRQCACVCTMALQLRAANQRRKRQDAQSIYTPLEKVQLWCSL